jgi:hypothetical protein
MPEEFSNPQIWGATENCNDLLASRRHFASFDVLDIDDGINPKMKRKDE